MTGFAMFVLMLTTLTLAFAPKLLATPVSRRGKVCGGEQDIFSTVSFTRDAMITLSFKWLSNIPAFSRSLRAVSRKKQQLPDAKGLASAFRGNTTQAS
ncbi:MAG: hypothetical protein HZA04_07855 [Nitrospinae bacterium]|nr:hypothetical protein [Nitrospinota bacterium]